MAKPTWLKDAIAKEDGYYNAKGERLKVARLTAEQIAEWNGVKPAPAVEVAEVEEPAEDTIVEKIVKKVSRKKKK
jgi:hypothetical protein